MDESRLILMENACDTSSLLRVLVMRDSNVVVYKSVIIFNSA